MQFMLWVMLFPQYCNNRRHFAPDSFMTLHSQKPFHPTVTLSQQEHSKHSNRAKGECKMNDTKTTLHSTYMKYRQLMKYNLSFDNNQLLLLLLQWWIPS